MRFRFAVVTVVAALLAACSGNNENGAGRQGEQATISIDGSSTVFPVTEAVAEEFQTQKRGAVRVVVGVSGTGGGFKKFCRGETDVQGASRPILKEEMEACAAAGVRYFELPVAFDAITVAVNPQNTWLNAITIDELKRIWEPAAQGKITRWNQVNPQWPDAPLELFGPGADSGTFDYFTDAVVGKSKASRGDFTASEDDNVLVQGIETNVNALGYIPYAYYAPHAERMKAVPVDSGNGPVLPSLENVLNGSYSPLSRPLFIYVSERSAQRPEVREFIEFYLTQGAPLVEEVRYLPLSPEIYGGVLQNFRNGKVGTAFGGEPEVGVEIGELLARETKL